MCLYRGLYRGHFAWGNFKKLVRKGSLWELQATKNYFYIKKGS